MSRVEDILDLLRDSEYLLAGISPLSLVLRLEQLAPAPSKLDVILEAWDEIPVADLWEESPDSALQVELLRLALRLDSTKAHQRLRSMVAHGNGFQAHAAAEALAAEGHAGAAQAVIDVLRRRREFQAPQELVVGWGVKLLRVLSGLSLDQLTEDVAPIWLPLHDLPSGPSERGLAALHEALAAELDFWLRRSDG